MFVGGSNTLNLNKQRNGDLKRNIFELSEEKERSEVASRLEKEREERK